MGAIIAGVLAFSVVFYVLIRALARRKAPVHEDPEEHTRYDILDLVKEEAEATGAAEVPGAEGVDLPVRLVVWRRDEAVRESCPDPSMLRFVVADGVDPVKATEDDVTLQCLEDGDDEESAAAEEPAAPESNGEAPTDDPAEEEGRASDS